MLTGGSLTGAGSAKGDVGKAAVLDINVLRVGAIQAAFEGAMYAATPVSIKKTLLVDGNSDAIEACADDRYLFVLVWGPLVETAIDAASSGQAYSDSRRHRTTVWFAFASHVCVFAAVTQLLSAKYSRLSCVRSVSECIRAILAMLL